jgi:hypothetical protein
MSVVESRRARDRLSQLSRRSSREGIGMSPMSLRSSQGLGMHHNTFAHIDDNKPKLLFREGII